MTIANLRLPATIEHRGDTHMTSTFRGWGGGLGKTEMLPDVSGWGWGINQCSERPIFIFFIKENWICAMTRHHGEPTLIYY